MNKTFEKICRMSQKALKNHVKQKLAKTHGEIVSGDGYVFAQGKFPVLLVAHLDTVHRSLPTIIEYDETQDIISSPNGIGGDDRCGVYMIFKILKRYNCSVLFCEDEEIGCVGAWKFAGTQLAKQLSFNYIIEFDRASANDAVFYRCANDKFDEFITKEFYKKEYGSFTDICEIAPVIGCAAVNLSCGYYNPHTTDEYVVLSEMERSIVEACKILQRTTENDKFEFIKGYNYSSYWNSNVSYENIYDDEDYCFTSKYYMFEYVNARDETEWWDTVALSKASAIGKFVMEFPSIPFENVIDISVDATVYDNYI